MKRQFTAIIEAWDDGFVALCPELDIASQGDSIAEARANLAKAAGLFSKTASPAEINWRRKSDVYVTNVEVPAG